MEKKYLNSKELADYFGVSVETIKKWRSMGVPFIKANPKAKNKGAKILYDPKKVEAWLEESQQ